MQHRSQGCGSPAQNTMVELDKHLWSAGHSIEAPQGDPSPLQNPDINEQVSPMVHEFPSSHAVPGDNLVPWHRPRVHVSPVVHGSRSSQGGEPGTALPVQRPAEHVSDSVHRLKSSQGAPSGKGFPAHTPARQVSASVHGLVSVQATDPSGTCVPMQRPAWHVSPSVQTR